MAGEFGPAQAGINAEALKICGRLNLLDENFPEDQLPLLKAWRIPVRQIGRGVARLGIKDSDIIPALHAIGRATFITLDEDFFRRKLCHAAHSIVWLDVTVDDAAPYLRRFLRHPRFRSQAARFGTVARAHHQGVHFWQRHRTALQHVEWVH